MCLNKAKFDSECTLSFSIGLPSLLKFVTVVHGSFYSYKSVRTCSEQRSVERRLSFAVEVATASGNWKHPLHLKIIFSTHFQWLLRFRNGRYLTPPTLRNKVWSTYLIYIHMYICYKCSTFPRRISIHIAPKVGIFPKVEGRGKYLLPKVIYVLMFHKGGLNIYFIT